MHFLGGSVYDAYTIIPPGLSELKKVRFTHFPSRSAYVASARDGNITAPPRMNKGLVTHSTKKEYFSQESTYGDVCHVTVVTVWFRVRPQGRGGRNLCCVVVLS